ncbi:hypothetical protein RSOLAG1IB_07276 [Rhizoctonia solani AG-1 IB]|uniref:Uncharacterized protein n=1 Tax=Thanatephorus cucumeris (strain AG1-IB / isolate 7/3/14) TaxID=1108050 RepID=A0A0B7FEV2_THACB|nr:hypothetical protein RSOLAG1IB_07276 [Rhizoctonia solani AG-1 IB]
MPHLRNPSSQPRSHWDLPTLVTVTSSPGLHSTCTVLHDKYSTFICSSNLFTNTPSGNFRRRLHYRLVPSPHKTIASLVPPDAYLLISSFNQYS